MDSMPLTYSEPGAGTRPAPYDPTPSEDPTERSIIGLALNAYMSASLRQDAEMMTWTMVAAMAPEDRATLRRNLEETQESVYRVVCKWTPDPFTLDTYRRLTGWS